MVPAVKNGSNVTAPALGIWMVSLGPLAGAFWPHVGVGRGGIAESTRNAPVVIVRS
jgi:hypothetical protein